MDKLNIQAHKNAMNSSDEYVMESFVTFEKVSPISLTPQLSDAICDLRPARQ